MADLKTIKDNKITSVVVFHQQTGIQF